MTIRQFMYPTGVRKCDGELIKLVKGRDYIIQHMPALSQIMFNRSITLENGDVMEYAWASEEIPDDDEEAI